ncbi:MAG TPA: hypothetical protein VMS93_03325 [Candidatus Saccharimonadales bacterium]|nr:hypothetical protein [Candidatus Saccharimonadales bacterium]
MQSALRPFRALMCAAALAGSAASGAWGGGPGAAAAPGAADPPFDAVWRDGRAELDGYRLTVQRYGHPRSGRAVLIYVTEPFSAAKHVKLDDPSRAPGDVLDVLKLNLVRHFQTGIYDYHTMISLFVRAADFAPVKEAFSGSEWCGQVYDEMQFGTREVTDRFSSYFEGESGATRLGLPGGGLAEDDLFILLRGLRGPFLGPGARRSVAFLPSPFYARLTHARPAWGTAEIERLAAPQTVRVPAGGFRAWLYVVRVPGQREGRFWVEAGAPHRILGWAWEPARGGPPRRLLGGTDAGELTGSARLPYWNLHDPGGEQYLRQLGLSAPVN